MKITLRIFSLLGIFLFATTFISTYGVPEFIEEAAQDFIKNRILQETQEKIDSLTTSIKDSKLGRLAQITINKNETEIARLKARLETKMHERVADVIAEMKNLDCECRKKYAQSIKRNIEFRITALVDENQQLTDFMKSKYMDIANKLRLDFRIFTGSNLLIFLLLFFVSLLKPSAITHLFLPGILLFISTLICSYFYLFEQNWFFTIIYNDYTGFGYLAYVILLFGSLCDIALNRGRITTEIINAILNAFGSAFTIAPC